MGYITVKHGMLTKLFKIRQLFDNKSQCSGKVQLRQNWLKYNPLKTRPYHPLSQRDSSIHKWYKIWFTVHISRLFVLEDDMGGGGGGGDETELNGEGKK